MKYEELIAMTLDTIAPGDSVTVAGRKVVPLEWYEAKLARHAALVECAEAASQLKEQIDGTLELRRGADPSEWTRACEVRNEDLRKWSRWLAAALAALDATTETQTKEKP